MPNKNAENCEHKQAAPRKSIEKLPPSQAGTGRHKCAVCAYRAGYEAAVLDVRQALLNVGRDTLETADAPS